MASGILSRTHRHFLAHRHSLASRCDSIFAWIVTGEEAAARAIRPASGHFDTDFLTVMVVASFSDAFSCYFTNMRSPIRRQAAT
jgi:hypothetical protein